MPFDPSPNTNTLTITVRYSLMDAPQVMPPVTRLSGETDEHLSARAVGYALDYGTAGQFGKLISIDPVWS